MPILRWQRRAPGGSSLAVLLAAAAAVLALDAAAQPPDDPDDDSDLFDLSLEELAEVQVTSVTGIARDWFQTPAAVHVISGDELRRSGHTSLVEMFRMVPGFFVGRVDSSQWSTGVRGFSDIFYPYLQVLIDGRVAYNELFGGVYWDVQTPLLEDLDTIEVVRGPGATLWGANAVNGVVNVTTKGADRTQGGYASSGGGDRDRAFGMSRYGVEVTDDVNLRVWGRYFNRGRTTRNCGPSRGCPPSVSDGSSRPDDWSVFRGGLRMDWDVDPDTRLMVQGEGYVTPTLGNAFALGQPGGATTVVEANGEAKGGHALVELTRARGSTSTNDANGFSLKAYYDVEDRENVIGFDQLRSTLDLDYRQYLTLADRFEVSWGGTYRYRHTETDSGPGLALDPSNQQTHLANFFVQSTITLVEDRLFAMVGSKFEYNSYTDFEAQPNVRLWWTPNERHTLWAAFSRPVRTPTLVEDALDSQLFLAGSPVPARILGDGSLDAETLLAFEAGYRVRPMENLTLDVAAFYFDYDDLISIVPVGAAPPTVRFRNQAEAQNAGVEVAAAWQPLDRWRLHASYSYLHVETSNEGINQLGDRDPDHMFQVRSYLDVTEDIELNTALYWVDKVRRFDISSYVRLDAGITWRPLERVSLSLWGQNLTEHDHPESQAASTNEALAEIRRGVYGRVEVRF